MASEETTLPYEIVLQTFRPGSRRSARGHGVGDGESGMAIVSARGGLGTLTGEAIFAVSNGKAPNN
jgi:hypothetical protein